MMPRVISEASSSFNQPAHHRHRWLPQRIMISSCGDVPTQRPQSIAVALLRVGVCISRGPQG